ncbi:MAG: adenylate/guanylate cyclase domain-containing protein [Rhodospirillales bacterium]
MGARVGIRVPLKAAMALATGGLMLLAVAGVLHLGYSAARETTREMLTAEAQTGIDAMIAVLARALDPIVDQALWIADELAAGRIDIDDRTRLDAFLRGSMAATPEVLGLAILTADHRSLRYHRGAPEVVDRDGSLDEDVRRYVADGRAASGPSWGRPFWLEDEGQTIVNLWTPLRRDGRFLGILAQAVGIGDLSRALVGGRSAETVVPFVLYARAQVLAHPGLAEGRHEFTREQPLPGLARFGDPVLARLGSGDARPLTIIDRTAIEGGIVRVDDLDYVVLFRELRRYADAPLTIGAYFRAGSRGTEQVERLRDTAVFGLAILGLSVGAALLIGRAIGSPILRLSAAARAVERGDLDRVPALPATPLREIDDASRSFNAMVQGLRERDLVRDLFGKYVPDSVAARLIRDRGATAPVSTLATVMFTDVAGFTGLSERMSPERLVSMLNEYFSVQAEILERHGGMITQFQGDGLLAVFNVPIADPDHATQAVAAAVEIRRAIAVRTFAGHALPMRIGITTGDVVAGSVGTSGRLSYTIYGDTVNLASRLEQLNKQFGTTILVAHSTVALAGEFPFARLGAVDVRGKSAPVTVYTLAA